MLELFEDERGTVGMTVVYDEAHTLKVSAWSLDGDLVDLTFTPAQLEILKTYLNTGELPPEPDDAKRT